MRLKVSFAFMALIVAVGLSLSANVAMADPFDTPPPNNVFISGGDLEYGGLYYLRPMESPLDEPVYENDNYYMWQEDDTWVISDKNYKILFQTGVGFQYNVVPPSLQFFTVSGGPSGAPRMDQVPPPESLVISGADIHSKAEHSTNEGGYAAWYDNLIGILIYMNNKSKSTSHQWRISKWPSMEMLYYVDSDETLPPRTGWKKADGTDSDLVVEGQQTGYISHITQGESDWTDYLEVDNLNSKNATFTLEFYPAGSAALTSFEIAAKATALVDIKALAPNATCAKVSTSPSVKLRAGYRNNGSGGVAEFFLNDFSATSVGYFFTRFNTNASWKGLSIMNPGTETANVTLYAYGDSGLLGTATTTVAAKTRSVGVTGVWFPTLKTSDILRIMAVSDQAILGIVITGNDSSSQITFTQASSTDGYSAP